MASRAFRLLYAIDSGNVKPSFIPTLFARNSFPVKASDGNRRQWQLFHCHFTVHGVSSISTPIARRASSICAVRMHLTNQRRVF